MNLLITLAILAVGLVGYIQTGGIGSYAHILSSGGTAPATTLTPPKSPDFLNTFNMYVETRSELGLTEQYSGLVLGESAETMRAYQTEILSYVDRIVNTPQQGKHLPMWPNHNVVTYGNAVAYLFPNEVNSLDYARGLGFVPIGAQHNAYLSRAEFLSLVGHIFVNENKDPGVILAELGFIDSAEQWKDTTRNGFPMVEGIRLILNIRELIERKNILASKALYEKNLLYLPDGSLELNESTLEVLTRAFAAERESGFQPRILESLKTTFSDHYGATLNAQLITDVRGAFTSAMNLDEAPLYQLPELQLLGDCGNEVFRKTYMGPVAITGPKGASIICDRVLIAFPANTYLINVWSLPKITELDIKDQLGVATVRTDVMRTYHNSLIVSEEGEQMVTLLMRPPGQQKFPTDSFGVIIEDQQGNEQVNMKKNYVEKGALLHLHLRALSGDHQSLFKYSL